MKQVRREELSVLEGVERHFDASRDCIVQRGLIDPYDMGLAVDQWVVLQDYIFWSARFQVFIVIPRWFITDLASVPRVFRRFISVNERHRLASLPHDLGYLLHRYFPEQDPFTRDEWDLLFKDFCQMQGVSKWKQALLFAGVNLGGWVTYNKEPGNIDEHLLSMAHREWYIHAYHPRILLKPEIQGFGVFR